MYKVDVKGISLEASTTSLLMSLFKGKYKECITLLLQNMDFMMESATTE
jgi:hypothetical protein